MDTALVACARRVRVGQGRFSWWVGVLQREDKPRFDVWQCGHQHDRPGEARQCVSDLVSAIRWASEPVRLRND
jgi:hypothetical protein